MWTEIVLILLQISQSVSMKPSVLPQTVGLLNLKGMLYLFQMINVQGRELYCDNLKKWIIDIGLCLAPYEMIFKHGMMVDN